MRFFSLAAIGLAVTIALGAPVAASAQTDDAAAAFVRVATSYSLSANITYQRAGGQDLTLDVYRSRAAAEPAPTLVYPTVAWDCCTSVPTTGRSSSPRSRSTGCWRDDRISRFEQHRDRAPATTDRK